MPIKPPYVTDYSLTSNTYVVALKLLLSALQSGDSEHTHLPPPPPPLPPPPPPHSSGPMPGAIPPSVPPQNLESKLKDDRDSRDTEEIKQVSLKSDCMLALLSKATSVTG